MSPLLLLSKFEIHVFVKGNGQKIKFEMIHKLNFEKLGK
jgi:hypothetical protein